jgi:hypothetical protein
MCRVCREWGGYGTDDGDGGVGGETSLLEEEGEVRGRVVLLLELDHALGHVGRHQRVGRNVVLCATHHTHTTHHTTSGIGVR